MPKIKISPSILSADFSKLGNEIQNLEKAKADFIHIDVMDGHFVPNITIGPEVIAKLRKYTSLPFDVHLMISPVHKFIKNFANAGADIITIHPEATENILNTIKEIKSFNKKVGISLNPETQIDKVLPVLSTIDLVLIMSVNPGFTLITKTKSIKFKTGITLSTEVSGFKDIPTFLLNDFIFFIELNKSSVASGCIVIISAPASAKF